MDGSKLWILLALAGAASAGVQSSARSEPSLQHTSSIIVAKDDTRATLDETPDFRASHRASDVLLQAVLRQRRNDDPEWLIRETGVDPFEAVDRAGPRPRYLALQIDRLDGTDLLTVRQALATIRSVHLYAGAGLGRAKYLDDDALAKPLPRRRGHHALGAAAEIGAQAQMGERVSVVASLRWMDLGRNVTLLKSDYGTMNADAAMLGVTVGYRFR